MKVLSRNDLQDLANATGRSLEEVMHIAQQSGWQYSDSPTKPLRGLDSASDAYAMMKLAKEQAISHLYQNDPLVRESINAQAAVEQARNGLLTVKPSNLNYDANGNLQGIKHSVVSGTHATGKHQTETMKAIRADIYKRFGVTE